MAKKNFTFKHAGRTWTLKCDTSEVFPDDPGNGTPLMVYAPNGETGTLYCTPGEGVISGDEQEVPEPVMRWLDSIQSEAEDFVYGKEG